MNGLKKMFDLYVLRKECLGRLEGLKVIRQHNSAVIKMRSIFNAYTSKIEIITRAKELQSSKRHVDAVRKMKKILTAYVVKSRTAATLKEVQSIMLLVMRRAKLCTKLSSIWKGNQQRKAFLKTVKAVIVAQRSFRCYNDRVKRQKLRKELRERRLRSAIKIQSLWRKYYSTRRYDAAMKISSLYHGYCVRKNVNVYLTAIASMQSNFRMNYCRYY